jgi:hypothetical protein
MIDNFGLYPYYCGGKSAGKKHRDFTAESAKIAERIGIDYFALRA